MVGWEGGARLSQQRLVLLVQFGRSDAASTHPPIVSIHERKPIYPPFLGVKPLGRTSRASRTPPKRGEELDTG